MPMVSVVIPTYNRPDLLPRAIRSVLAQTFQDFEIVVVDDGDIRSAKDVVGGFGDPRIRYLKNQPPKRGGGATRNVGIKESSGEFVAFLDDDDEWDSAKLEIQMARFLVAPENAGFCFSAITSTLDGHEEHSVTEDGIIDFSEIILRRFNGFLTSTLVVRKSVLVEVGGFDEKLPSHQEPELLIRITRKYLGIGINEPLVRMNMSPREHIGGSIDRRIRGREMLLEKHEALYKKYSRALSASYFQLGLWYRDCGQIGPAREYFWKAFLLSGNLRYLIHGVLMLLR